ncbi:MAG: DUF742 domain-containing protein [Haloechinothrix sp.]
MNAPSEPSRRGRKRRRKVGRTGARFPSAHLQEEFDADPDPADTEILDTDAPPADIPEQGSPVDMPVAGEDVAGPDVAAGSTEPDARKAAEPGTATQPGDAVADTVAEEPSPEEPAAPAEGAATAQAADAHAGDDELLDDVRSWVRPYVWTGGRTDHTLEFALETLVSARKPAEESDIDAMRDEHRRVLDLCAQPRSVTEIAALLSVPLGVAKTLLGAMAEENLLVVHANGNTGVGPDLELMERVLRGLRNL